MIIYKATNKENGKAYIGQTIFTLHERKRHHCSEALRGSNRCRVFARALRKYGTKSFDWTIIDAADTLEDLNILEELWIEAENSLVPGGYNLCSGGGNSIPSKETRKRMSDNSGLSKKVTIDKQEFRTILQAAKSLGLGLSFLRLRVRQYGYSLTKKQLTPKRCPLVSIVIDNQKYSSIKQAAKRLNLNYSFLRDRVRRHGRVLTERQMGPGQKGKTVSLSIDGQDFNSIKQAAKSLNVEYCLLRYRVKKYGTTLIKKQMESQQCPNRVALSVDGQKFNSILKAASVLGIAKNTVRSRLKSPLKKFANYLYDQ